MSPDDARSMCCRLRLDNRELYRRGGSLFGSAPLTGSIGVVTVNLPQVGYLSKTKKDFFERLGRMMDWAKDSLEIKRKVLDSFMERGLYPYSRYYLESVKKIRGSYWGNHFSTIGLIGMNECLLNFIDKDITTSSGQKFAAEVLDFMRDRLVGYQKETENLYNLEATPGEGISYRFAHLDKKKFPDIVTAGEKEPYYTNSSHLPVGFTDDIFEALKLQDNLQTKYTGGTVLHGFIGERINDHETIKTLLKRIFGSHQLPYLTFTPTFSICPNHGYLNGEHFTCPHCLLPQQCEVYSRVVGYIRPVQQWHVSKQEEYKDRKVYVVGGTAKIDTR
jgi:ribonucleoside-triphosphate reductase